MDTCSMAEWQRGNYFEGVIDGNKLDETLELHRRSTVSTFGTRRSCRAAVATNKQVANSENVRYAVFRMQNCVLIIKNVKRH